MDLSKISVEELCDKAYTVARSQRDWKSTGKYYPDYADLTDELARRLAELQARHEPCDHYEAGQDAEIRHWQARAETLQKENKSLLERAEAAEAVVAKLPKTADGVAVVPGDRVYPLHPLSEGLDPEEAADIDDFLTIVLAGRGNECGEHYIEGDGLDIKTNYSTREAAKEATRD